MGAKCCTKCQNETLDICRNIFLGPEYLAYERRTTVNKPISRRKSKWDPLACIQEANLELESDDKGSELNIDDTPTLDIRRKSTVQLSLQAPMHPISRMDDRQECPISNNNSKSKTTKNVRNGRKESEIRSRSNEI